MSLESLKSKNTAKSGMTTEKLEKQKCLISELKKDSQDVITGVTYTQHTTIVDRGILKVQSTLSKTDS